MHSFRLLIILAITLPCFSLTAQQESKPNVLLIVCDDLNQMGNGTLYDPTLHTPYIDSFASQSVVFDNAHANIAACGPSRASMFSGVHPKTSGHYGYRMRLNSWLNDPVLAPTTSVFRQLMDHDYLVYGSGKIYHAERYKEEDFHDYNSEPQQGPFPYGLRTHSDLPPEFDERNISFSTLENVPSYPEYEGWLNRNGTPFMIESDDNRDLLGDELTVQYCDSIMAEYASGSMEQPLFLTAGIYNPHEPFHIPQKYWDLYDPAEFDFDFLQPDSEFPVVTATTNRWNWKGNVEAYDMMLEYASEEDSLEYLRSYIHGYYASVSFVDDQIGALLESLENHGLSDNTIVIFTSDHGFHLGSKGIVKKTTMWNDATAIPFMIKVPGLQPQIISTPVSLIDLYPTICDLTEVPEPDSHELDGNSLKSVYFGGQNTALVSAAAKEVLELDEPGKVNHNHHGLLAYNYKYILWSSGEDELYNLNNDYREINNLASNPNFLTIKNSMYQLLRKEIGDATTPEVDYECLFYGDFDQELNGWTPSEPNSNVEFSSGDSILPGSHIILSENPNVSFRNLSLKFTAGGLHNLSFTAYCESSDESEIRILIDDPENTYFDEFFTISQTKSDFSIEFMMPQTLPKWGDAKFKVFAISGDDIHLDNFSIVNIEQAQEAISPCINAEPIQSNIALTDVEIENLESYMSQPDIFCQNISGTVPQLWLKFIPQSDKGVVACNGIERVDPLIECFTECEVGVEPLACSDNGEGIRFVILTDLIPGETYFVRISDIDQKINASNSNQLIKAIYLDIPAPQLVVTNHDPAGQELEIGLPDYLSDMVNQIDIRFHPEGTGETREYRIEPNALGKYSFDQFDQINANLNYNVSVRYRIDQLEAESSPSSKNIGKSVLAGSEFDRDIHVHPNPYSPNETPLVINLSEKSTEAFAVFTVEIFDLSGKRVFENRNISADQSISVEGLPPLGKGFYFLVLSDQKGNQFTESLLIE